MMARLAYRGISYAPYTSTPVQPASYIAHMNEPAEVKVASLKSRWSAMVTAYAYHDQTLLALSMVGPATALDAIRANIVMGRGVTMCVNLPEPRYVSPQPYYGSTGYYETHQSFSLSTDDQRYVLYKSRVLNRDDHYILVNRRVIEPRYDDDPIYVICPIDEPEWMSIGRGLEQALDIPVLPEWYVYLAQVNAARTEYGVRSIAPVDGQGFNILAIRRAPAWQKIISEALAKGEIEFPSEEL